jgi:serine/threonine protein kinase
MMIDICEGMEFLHSDRFEDGSRRQVLFHQDLKSGNVLLCMEGSPAILSGKICDFGLSCKSLSTLKHIVLKDTQVNRNLGLIDGHKSSTKVAINGRTSCYNMAPELFTRKAKFSRIRSRRCLSRAFNFPETKHLVRRSLA